MTKNWLKIATAAEQAIQDNQAATQPGDQQPGVPQPGGQPKQAIEPKPTQTPQQKSYEGKQQRAQLDAIRDVVLPDVARIALPAMNQSLHFLMNELMSRDDLRLTEDTGRKLAIDIMAAWLGASKMGAVSDLGTILTRSKAVETTIGALY